MILTRCYHTPVVRPPHVSRPCGFTLVEVLIVVVIMGILAATALPSFVNPTGDARTSTCKQNISQLRAQIELYKAQHGGLLPSATLAELLTTTNASGAIGSGIAFPYGPYVAALAENPLTGSNTVAAPTTVPPTAPVAGAGYLYDPASGGLWINDPSSTLLGF